MSATATLTTTYTHVVTHFADKMLMLLGNIIRDSGLSISKFASDRSILERGIKTWLQSGHLKKVTLEIFKPNSTVLIRRWDLEWDQCEAAEASFWVDINDIKYHLNKTGVVASDCPYRFVVDNRDGRPDVLGFSSTTYSDSSNLKQYSLGTTISGGGYGSRTSYWK
jgi:hypothetical protein